MLCSTTGVLVWIFLHFLEPHFLFSSVIHGAVLNYYYVIFKFMHRHHIPWHNSSDISKWRVVIFLMCFHWPYVYSFYNFLSCIVSLPLDCKFFEGRNSSIFTIDCISGITIFSIIIGPYKCLLSGLMKWLKCLMQWNPLLHWSSSDHICLSFYLSLFLCLSSSLSLFPAFSLPSFVSCSTYCFLVLIVCSQIQTSLSWSGFFRIKSVCLLRFQLYIHCSAIFIKHLLS